MRPAARKYSLYSFLPLTPEKGTAGSGKALSLNDPNRGDLTQGPVFLPFRDHKQPKKLEYNGKRKRYCIFEIRWELSIR